MNFIKAPLSVFEEYHITPSRILADGEGIQHFETINPIWIQLKLETRCTFWSYEAMLTYLDWTEPEVQDGTNES